MVHALTLMTTDPQVRRVFDVATHKVEYTHDMASVQQRHLDARNACVGDFEKPCAWPRGGTASSCPCPAPPPPRACTR